MADTDGLSSNSHLLSWYLHLIDLILVDLSIYNLSTHPQKTCIPAPEVYFC